MSTRSLTIIKDEGHDLLVMYRHMDGYPTGHGQELADFVKGFKITNGISLAENGKTANGMGCFAAQLVAHFKTQFGVGQIYIQPAGCRDVGEDYQYTIYMNKDNTLNLKAENPSRAWDKRKLYEGLAEGFDGKAVEKAEYPEEEES